MAGYNSNLPVNWPKINPKFTASRVGDEPGGLNWPLEVVLSADARGLMPPGVAGPSRQHARIFPAVITG